MKCKYCKKVFNSYHQPERNHHLAGHCLEKSRGEFTPKSLFMKCEYCKKVVNYNCQPEKNHQSAGHCLEESKGRTEHDIIPELKLEISHLKEDARDKDELIESLRGQVKSLKEAKHLNENKTYRQQVKILKDKHGISGCIPLENRSYKVGPVVRAYQYLNDFTQLKWSKIQTRDILSVAVKYKEGVEEIATAAYNHILKDRYVVIDTEKKMSVYLDEANNVKGDTGCKYIPAFICFLILSITKNKDTGDERWGDELRKETTKFDMKHQVWNEISTTSMSIPCEFGDKMRETMLSLIR